MSILTTIEQKLQQAFSAHSVAAQDRSAGHAGHAGVQGLDSHISHVAILVVSECFAGMSRVDRQRAVYAVIGEEIRQIHAIDELKAITPDEYARVPKRV